MDDLSTILTVLGTALVTQVANWARNWRVTGAGAKAWVAREMASAIHSAVLDDRRGGDAARHVTATCPLAHDCARRTEILRLESEAREEVRRVRPPDP